MGSWYIEVSKSIGDWSLQKSNSGVQKNAIFHPPHHVVFFWNNLTMFLNLLKQRYLLFFSETLTSLQRFPDTHTQLTMYYIRLLLYDTVKLLLYDLVTVSL